MLTDLNLVHFKCFEKLKIPIAPLTLLSGSNASGKSTILQTLVLLHQTMKEQEWSTRLMLNGDTIKLGTVSDVVDKVNGRRSFQIGAVYSGRSYQWSFTGERNDMSMGIDAIKIDDDLNENPVSLRHLLPEDLDFKDRLSIANFLVQLSYITAERVGPREVYTLEDRQAALVVGARGEHAVSVLHWGRDEQILPELAISGIANTRLHQVEAYMKNFFPGCSLDLQQVPRTNAVTLGLRTSDDTDFHRPVHVGFGLTQVFPIIVAALSASRGVILLIENPEVHLHPAGQALMGQFLAEVSNAGVQVIIESHSDHILNGIRRAVKADRLSSEKVALYFFRPRTKEVAQVETPQIDQLGNLDNWPDGFFDQFDKDTNFFAGWGE